MKNLHTLLNLVILTALTGCGNDRPIPDGALVITQAPRILTAPSPASGRLSDLYPEGTRLVLSTPPHEPDEVRVLSSGLSSAGAPAIAPDGRRLVFCGRNHASDSWQLYEVILPDGDPRRLTNLEGGASHPAHLPGGRIVFTSPTVSGSGAGDDTAWPALHVLETNGTSSRLSFGVGVADGATVLADGRILFVGKQPSDHSESQARSALFTINSDGTGLRPFAAHHEGLPGIRRPRETSDGRIVFLGSPNAATRSPGRAEQVLLSRPFMSRGPFDPRLPGDCRSLEPEASGLVLAALPLPTDDADTTSYAIFAVRRGDGPGQKLLFDDPRRDDVEAVSVAVRAPPRGRPSTVNSGLDTGTLLCLDANDTHEPMARHEPSLRAGRVRVVGLGSSGETLSLGEATVHEDGSFLLEVPADRPLGLELMDVDGTVLRRLSPSLWVRPGEIRACPGCHARHAHGTRNIRPMAVALPAAQLKPRRAPGANGGLTR